MNVFLKRKWTNIISIIRGGLIKKIKESMTHIFISTHIFMHYSRGNFPKELCKYITYMLKDGLQYYGGDLCIHENTNCVLKILYEYHNILIVNHPKFQKNYIMIKKKFFWLGIKRDIHDYVERCYPYQTSKIEQIKTLKLLQQLTKLTTK